MHIRFHAIEVGTDKGRKVHFVDDTDITSPEHHGMLVHNIVSLGSADNDDPDFGSEKKIGRTDHIPDILDKQNINLVEGEVF